MLISLDFKFSYRIDFLVDLAPCVPGDTFSSESVTSLAYCQVLIQYLACCQVCVQIRICLFESSKEMYKQSNQSVRIISVDSLFVDKNYSYVIF